MRLKEYMNIRIYEDPKEISEVLNKNFQKIFTTESDFKKLQAQVRKMRCRNKEEIEEMMKKLDERRPNGVSRYIFKECRQEMTEPIHDIIECSIKTGKVPKEWKKDDMIPLYKNGNKEEPLDYRPVSLISMVYKICEKVIKKQWSDYLEREGIITNKQFGFRTGRSCVTNLVSFYSE